MDMKDTDLKKYYQASLKENPPLGSECPDLEVIIRSFSKESRESEKIKVVDHISVCGLCYKKFEAVRQILRESKNLAEQFEGLTLSEAEVGELKQRAVNRIRELGVTAVHQRKSSFSDKLSALFKQKFPLKFATAVAAIFIIFAVAIVLLKIPQNIKEDRLRGSREVRIQMVSPKDEIQVLPLAFEWQPVSGAKKYQVVLLDDELTRIWTSGMINETKVAIPPEIRNSFLQEKDYYWKVVISYGDNTQIESDLQKFTLTKNPRFPD